MVRFGGHDDDVAVVPLVAQRLGGPGARQATAYQNDRFHRGLLDRVWAGPGSHGGRRGVRWEGSRGRGTGSGGNAKGSLTQYFYWSESPSAGRGDRI
ncbi:hypothetical protein GCM10009751_15790 [Myceligenerans crystallogenes]|uniref:Uncharacterized protein n=1 Tax=Myceligenerans crystallogenes TaxID=316335 RepID=A0ABN2NB13_9MICO